MSTDLLRDEHNELRREARQKRREFARSPESAFVREMDAAMRGYHEMRAQGVSREDGCRGLEHVMRATWPKPTTKFAPACDVCDDTGWRLLSCTHEMRCRRRRCEDAHPAVEHTYTVPCDCEKGDRMRPRASEPQSDYAQLGKTKKPKTFSRFGS